MPTSVRGGHLHDSKIVVEDKFVGGSRWVRSACSDCGEVHEWRKARATDGPVAS
jgi:hypothetical protein